jgi:hypothetical protein
LSTVEQQLSPNERREIESRLASYQIPFQILQIIAQECNCTEAISSGRETRAKGREHSLISRMNDKALIQLRQTFLDCEDSFSRFRFAVLLSSKFNPARFKFVIEKHLRGESNQEYLFDVCVYSRATEELVAAGMQNNDTAMRATDGKLMQKYLNAIVDVWKAHPTLRGAYYSSSYGYGCDPSRLVAQIRLGKDANLEFSFLEFYDRVYRQARGQ